MNIYIKINLYLDLLIYFPCLTSAQNCNCINAFRETVSVVKENYVGFIYMPVKAKRELSGLEKRLLSLSSFPYKYNCTRIIGKYLSYFKDPHILAINYSDTIVDNYFYDETKSSKLNLKKKVNGLEGYWIDKSKKNLIYIYQVTKNSYRGIIIKTLNKNWKKGDVKLEIYLENNKYYSVFTLSDKSKFYEELKLKDSIILIQTYQKYAKCSLKDTLKMDGLMGSAMIFPTFEILDSVTAIMKIPVSGFKEKVDSIFEQYRNFFIKKNHLIVDVRNNAGGTIPVFYRILDLVKQDGLYWEGYYSMASQTILAKDSILLKEALENKDTSIAEYWKEEIRKIRNSSGKTYYTDKEKIDSLSANEIGKISIMINQKCMSAAELFVLAARQSKRVKLFGSPTYGCVDYGDLIDYELKACRYEITLPATKLKRSFKHPLDFKGIKPDYDLTNSSEETWIKCIQYIRK
jgi:C-terminal processing protease CtpA/Prc